MDYKVVEHPGLKVIGSPLRTTLQEGRAIQEIPAHWQRCIQDNVVASIPNRKGEEAYGVYSEYEGDFTEPYTLVVGAEVEAGPAPEGLVEKSIAPGKFAVFTVEGEGVEAIGHTWAEIWQTPLDRTYAVDFERYPAGFFSGTSADPVEIYISIE